MLRSIYNFTISELRSTTEQMPPLFVEWSSTKEWTHYPPPPIWRSDKMQNFASLDAQNASPYPTKSNTSSHKMKTNDFKCSSVWNSDCVADAFSAMRFFLQVQFVESQNVESNVRDQGWRGWLGVVSLQRPWKWQKFDLYIFRSFLQIFIYQQPADMNGKLH
jgi:hypothetical protein